jgi:hypothetical protein
MSTNTLAASSNSNTLDFDHVLHHAGGDCELLMQLCHRFLLEVPIRMERLHTAVARGELFRAGRALLQLRNCIAVFGSGRACCTAQSLESAIRGRRLRSVQREWRRLEGQVQHLIPQVQRLMLEMATPTTRIQ